MYNLNICFVKYQSTHLGLPQSLLMQFLHFPWFLQYVDQSSWIEGKPLHIWTVTGLVVTGSALVMSENWFVMVMMDVDVVD